eukprot:scaffold58701_cov51-Phaeocystis_antarctica.AAC.3
MGVRRQERAHLLEDLEHWATHQPVHDAQVRLALDGGGPQVEVAAAGPELLRNRRHLALGPPAGGGGSGKG